MIVADVDMKAFNNTMHEKQTEVKLATLCDSFRDVDAKASADTLSDSRKRLRDTDGCEGRITSLKTGRHSCRGEGQNS